MSIPDRIKKIRKDKELSQKSFGEKLGVSRDVINNIENERVEPTELIQKAICNEYGVSYNWLRYGNGEMYTGANDESIAAMVEELMSGENETAKAVFRAFVKMDESDWNAIRNLIQAISDDLKK